MKKVSRTAAGARVSSSQPIKGAVAVVSGKSSAGTLATRAIPSSGGEIGVKIAKVSRTLGNMGRKTASVIKTTTASSKGTYFVKSATSRTATMTKATLTLATFLGSILLVASTVAVGYLTYVGIRDLFGEKKRKPS